MRILSALVAIGGLLVAPSACGLEPDDALVAPAAASPPSPPASPASPAPHPEPGHPGQRHDRARQALLDEDTRLASAIARLGEADGLWPALAEDGAYLHPGVDLILGRHAAREFLRRTFPDRAAQTQRLHRVAGDASADGELGYSFGWFDEDVTAQDGTTTTKYGKYLAAWRRAGGTWRLAAFARVASSRAPSDPPADAGILAGEHGVAHPGDPEALRRQVLAADAAFAARSVAEGYTVAFTGTCAPDAVVVGGSNFFWNAAGVATAWGGWTPAQSLDWAPLVGRAAASGDLGYTVGTATFSNDQDGTVSRSYSKYLTVWIRAADGSWKFLLDGGNARPAPAAP